MTRVSSFLLVWALLSQSFASPAFFALNQAAAVGCTTSGDAYTGASSSANNIGNLSNKSQDYAAIKLVTATQTATICTVVVPLAKSGSPTFNLFCAIYTDNAGSPGTLIGTESSAVSSSTLLSTKSDITFSGMSASVTSGSTYWVVVHTTFNYVGNGTDYVLWYYVFASGAGVFKYTADPAGTWSLFSSNTKANFTFFH